MERGLIGQYYNDYQFKMTFHLRSSVYKNFLYIYILNICLITKIEYLFKYLLEKLSVYRKLIQETISADGLDSYYSIYVYSRFIISMY